MIEHQQNALLGVGSKTAWTHGENVPGDFFKNIFNYCNNKNNFLYTRNIVSLC